MSDLKEQEDRLVNNLNIIKEKFIKDQETLKFSIRRDVIIVALKDLLANNKNYEALSKGIEKYIKELQDLDFLNSVKEK